MKFKKIMIILIFLLTVFTLGSVYACENITEENFTQNDINEVLAVQENNDVIFSNETEIANEINVTFDQQMWVENLSDIQVQLPENAEGTFCLKIGDLEVYNQTITNKTLNIPVKLPEPKFPYIIEKIYPPRDCTNYKITAFYNDMQLNLTESTLMVMKFPPDYEYMWSVSSEVLQYDPSLWSVLIFPRSANGIAEIYVDNKLINKTTVKGPYVYYNSSEINSLTLGNHTMRIVYYGDSYYYDANKTISFEVVNVKIDIPERIYIGHDDCIAVEVLKNTEGEVKVYVDNELAYTGTADKNGEFILSLEKYLKYNTSSVKVEFVGKELSREKIVPVNITYDFGYYDGRSAFIYGEDNLIELILPDYFNNTLLSVTINGTKFTFTHPEHYMNNIVEIDISKLDIGNYTVVISYPGDYRYTAYSESHYINVFYNPLCPDYIDFKDNSSARLTLPNDANGNLTLYINGELYKTVKLVKGKSSIDISDLMPSKYNLTAIYDGEDYIVKNTTITLIVNPKITVNYFFTAGQDKSVTVEVPKDCKGYVIFYIDAVEHKANIKDGIVKYSFKNLKAGKHIVYVEYYGENGFKSDDDNLITIYKPKLKIISSKIYTNAVNVKVKVTDNNGKVIKNAQVTFKINGKAYKAKTNSKGIAAIKKHAKLQAKKYKVTATYNGGKTSKTITAKHVLSLKTINVKKSSPKLVLTATLKEGNKAIKYKTVTFKFNGKTYKAKTNSKGIAKVTVNSNALKNLTVGKTVKYQASYLKDIIKKTGTVKQ